MCSMSPEPVLSPTTWSSVLSHVSLLYCASLLDTWSCALVPCLGHIVVDLVRGLPAPVLPPTTWPSALGHVSWFDHAPLLAWPCTLAPLPGRAPSGPCAPGLQGFTTRARSKMPPRPGAPRSRRPPRRVRAPPPHRPGVQLVSSVPRKMPPRPGASRGVRTQLIAKRTSAEPAVPRTCPRGHRLLCGAATSAVFVPASPHGTPEMPPRTGASRCVRTLSTIERVPALSLHQVARESRGGRSLRLLWSPAVPQLPRSQPFYYRDFGSHGSKMVDAGQLLGIGP